MVHVSFSRAINNREIILVFIDLKDFWNEFRKSKKTDTYSITNTFQTIITRCTQNGPRIPRAINNREIILVIDEDFLFLLERVKILK